MQCTNIGAALEVVENVNKSLFILLLQLYLRYNIAVMVLITSFHAYDIAPANIEH